MTNLLRLKYSILSINLTPKKMSKSEPKSSVINLNAIGSHKITKRIIYFSAVLTICLTGLGQIPPNPWGGFYCGDPTIQEKRGLDTMPTTILFVLLFFPTIFVMYLTEKMSRSGIINPVDKQVTTNGQKKQSGPWQQTKVVYSHFLKGLLLTTFVNEVIKVIVAEPRPHFYETCNPDLTGQICPTGNSFIYYTDIHCHNTNSAGDGVAVRITDSMKSFPSGHAQLSAYAAIYMMLYLYSPSLSTRVGIPWKAFNYIFFTVFAIVASYSRVSDHRHHWWDVLAGDIFGITTAILLNIFCPPVIERRLER